MKPVFSCQYILRLCFFSSCEVNLLGGSAGKRAKRNGVVPHTPLVDDEDERNCEFQSGCDRPPLLVPHHDECDRERDLDEDERQLDPETDPQHAVLAEVYP